MYLLQLYELINEAICVDAKLIVTGLPWEHFQILILPMGVGWEELCNYLEIKFTDGQDV